MSSLCPSPHFLSISYGRKRSTGEKNMISSSDNFSLSVVNINNHLSINVGAWRWKISWRSRWRCADTDPTLSVPPDRLVVATKRSWKAWIHGIWRTTFRKMWSVTKTLTVKALFSWAALVRLAHHDPNQRWSPAPQYDVRRATTIWWWDWTHFHIKNKEIKILWHASANKPVWNNPWSCMASLDLINLKRASLYCLCWL